MLSAYFAMLSASDAMLSADFAMLSASDAMSSAFGSHLVPLGRDFYRFVSDLLGFGSVLAASKAI